MTFTAVEARVVCSSTSNPCDTIIVHSSSNMRGNEHSIRNTCSHLDDVVI